MYVIYALVDPRDNTVRYVGMTKDVYVRFSEHINCSGGNFAKSAWILELRAANKMVIMETLEEVETREEAETRETYWIQHFQHMREPLMNISKTTSPRNAKKTNLRIGRDIGVELAEAAMRTAQFVHLVQSGIPQPIEVPASSPATPGAFRLSDPEKREFLAAYKASGNIKKALRGVGHGARYYQHARQILRENGMGEDQ